MENLQILIYPLAYLIGSIPFGFLIVKVFGQIDVRTIGSGNIGATNVLRTGSKKLAAITLFFDAVKGAALILIITRFSTFTIPDFSSADPLIAPDFIYILSLLLGLLSIIGHCFPLWLKFKGGKGVATTIGVLLVAVPYAGLAACGAWLICAFTFRISSLAALIAMIIAPIVTLLVYGSAPALINLIIAVIVFLRHKDNIKRLVKGDEPKIGNKKESKE